MLCDPKETHPFPHCSRHLRLPPHPEVVSTGLQELRMGQRDAKKN